MGVWCSWQYCILSSVVCSSWQCDVHGCVVFVAVCCHDCVVYITVCCSLQCVIHGCVVFTAMWCSWQYCILSTVVCSSWQCDVHDHLVFTTVWYLQLCGVHDSIMLSAVRCSLLCDVHYHVVFTTVWYSQLSGVCCFIAVCRKTACKHLWIRVFALYVVDQGQIPLHSLFPGKLSCPIWMLDNRSRGSNKNNAVHFFH